VAALTTYLENKLLRLLVLQESFTPPGQLYMGLFVTPTGADGSGTELAGGSYARRPVVFGPPVGGVSTNTNVLTYNNLPAATITHAAIFDAPAGGFMLFQGSLTTTRAVQIGDSAGFSVGTIEVELD
jgi:hypothetical protein